jgi:hypothetical protein
MFSVFDSKIGAFHIPFYARSTGEAVRMFSQAVSDPNSVVANHPGDFTLFEVGVFDDLTCKIDLLESRMNLGTALELKSQ